MDRWNVPRGASLVLFALLAGIAVAAHAKGDLRKVNHVIIVMQENHSFDNYFGALPYVPDGPYHAGPCRRNDHRCVDGLTCERKGSRLECKNWNLDADAPPGKRKVQAFNLTNYCPAPDLNHEWLGSHQEANFDDPRNTLRQSLNDGFVRVNDATRQIDTGESNTEDETMGYYDQADLPFYYGLAQTFAISDRYFSSVLGPTLPNRAYSMAATSFGHLTTDGIDPGLCADESAPPASEQPGFGANCAISKIDAKSLCPEFDPLALHPTYPASCPNFDQLGFRVPFMAVSPFSKPGYVSHVVADH